MGKFDIRILKLNKWYVPKTHKLNGAGNQIVIGYFDSVEIVPVEGEYGEEHPFIEGYNQLVKWKERQKQELVDHSSQEQILFANISDKEDVGFSETEIEVFWKDEGWPYLFISMIHISHSGKIEEALKKIREVFQDNYLCYVSFDYCDLIVFAKNIYINDYLNKIKKLFQHGGGSLFFDSFSMVSFNDSYLNQENKERETKFQAGCEKDKFQATINLSIRNYEKFKTWYDEIKATTQLYNMFGRYDVSIVQAADTEWLLKVMEKLHNEKNQEIFWTFETFIKLEEKDIEGYVIEPNPMTEEYYDTIKETLGNKINELYQIVEKSSLINKNNFIFPICEVRDCICSIIKNNFAEELIYCIYESFSEFIEYMTNAITKLEAKNKYPNISEKKIAECYDNYFTALNALVNSTMHSDRQFIQATTFNAIFYSVPPKIMAFYNVYIYRLKEILKDRDKEEKISYLIYPSFSPEVSSEKISLDENPPCERILRVKVNEKALYDTSLVTYQLVHELAHSIGNRIRCRKLRMRNMFQALLRYVIEECGIADEKIRKAFGRYLEEVWLMENTEGEYLDISRKKCPYFLMNLSTAAIESVPQYLEEIYKKNTEDEKILCDEIIETIGMGDNSQQKQYLKYYLPQYCKQKGFWISEKIEKVYGETDSKEEYVRIVEILYSTYYECYADLQMLLVLKVSPEDYLNMFIKKEGISVDELVNDFEDVIRVCTIFKVMMDCGMWKISTGDKIYKLIEIIGKYNDIAFAVFPDNEIKERSDYVLSEIKELLKNFEDSEKWFENKIFGSNVDDFDNVEIMDLGIANILLFDLYEYLLHVVKETLVEHKDAEKRKKIKEVQDNVKIMIEKRSIIEVYNCIEAELQKYGAEMFGE